MRYQRGFGSPVGRSAANANEASIKLRFRRNYELNTVFGDAGVAGVYLDWTRQY